MREAADILSSKAAIQIRYLDTIKALEDKCKFIFFDDNDDNYSQKSAKNNE